MESLSQDGNKDDYFHTNSIHSDLRSVSFVTTCVLYLTFCSSSRTSISCHLLTPPQNTLVFMSRFRQGTDLNEALVSRYDVFKGKLVQQ